MADRVILINEGRLVYDGRLADMDPRRQGTGSRVRPD